uniref:Uncharacterized protein n=1 Tax=Rhizophora mucronata TaxID=61149 RepID=A0A2P2NXF5_RHIMU
MSLDFIQKGRGRGKNKLFTKTAKP